MKIQRQTRRKYRLLDTNWYLPSCNFLTKTPRRNTQILIPEKHTYSSGGHIVDPGKEEGTGIQQSHPNSFPLETPEVISANTSGIVNIVLLLHAPCMATPADTYSLQYKHAPANLPRSCSLKTQVITLIYFPLQTEVNCSQSSSSQQR